MTADRDNAAPAPNGHPPEDFRRARRERAELGDPLKVDRLPPHSAEAEQGVLGCILLAPPECIPLARRVLRETDGGEFYLLTNRGIWQTVCRMFDEGLPIDLITLQQRLKDNNHLEEVGGLSYLAGLPDNVPSAANLEHYLNIVREKFVLRQLVGTCTKLVGRAYEWQGTLPVLIKDLTADVEALTESARDPREVGRRLLKPVEFDQECWDAWFGGRAGEPGLHLPESAFGDFPFKIRPGELTFVLGEKGAGKTTTLQYIALHLMAQGMKCAIASMEMHRADTMKILMAQLLGCKTLPDNDWGHQQFHAAFTWLNSRVRVYDFIGIAPWRELLPEMEVAAASGFKLFLVDSVMRLGILDDDYAEQGQCASQFARFCMECESHLLLVNHLNRNEKSRGSQQWIDNAHNVCAIKRNEKRLALDEELKAQVADKIITEAQRFEELKAANEQKDLAWMSKFELRNQRWPGARQNASRYLYFHGDSLQLYDRRWTQPAMNWLEQWGKKP